MNDESEINPTERFVTPKVWEKLSLELRAMKSGEICDGFYVATNRPGNRIGSEWDTILKVYYRNGADKISHVKFSVLSFHFYFESVFSFPVHQCISVRICFIFLYNPHRLPRYYLVHKVWFIYIANTFLHMCLSQITSNRFV